MSGSTRTPSAAGPVLHTDRKLGPCLKDGAVEWPPSPRQCSACALFSYVRSAILTDERFLHFQLRRDTSENTGDIGPVSYPRGLCYIQRARTTRLLKIERRESIEQTISTGLSVPRDAEIWTRCLGVPVS